MRSNEQPLEDMALLLGQWGLNARRCTVVTATGKLTGLVSSPCKRQEMLLSILLVGMQSRSAHLTFPPSSSYRLRSLACLPSFMAAGIMLWCSL